MTKNIQIKKTPDIKYRKFCIFRKCQYDLLKMFVQKNHPRLSKHHSNPPPPPPCYFHREIVQEEGTLVLVSHIRVHYFFFILQAQTINEFYNSSQYL